MQFGLATLTRGPLGNRNGYIAVAEEAERLGFGFIGVNDHIVVPGDIASRYPYSEEGQWPARTAGECLDQLATLAFIAGRTERIRLLTSVLVVPQRHPVLTAKLLSTVDVLSAGRLIAGCGVGWLKEEFEAVGAPPFAERGRVTDEYLAAFRALWTSERPSMAGTYASFGNVMFEPKPVQKPHPPLWIGGESEVAMRRAIRAGDAWYPASNNPQRRLDTAARITAAATQLREMCQAAGRDPASLGIASIVLTPVDWAAQSADNGERRLFTGSSADMIADAHALRAAGVGHVCVTLQAAALDETLARMQRFAEEVMVPARSA